MTKHFICINLQKKHFAHFAHSAVAYLTEMFEISLENLLEADNGSHTVCLQTEKRQKLIELWTVHLVCSVSRTSLKDNTANKCVTFMLQKQSNDTLKKKKIRNSYCNFYYYFLLNNESLILPISLVSGDWYRCSLLMLICIWLLFKPHINSYNGPGDKHGFIWSI